METEIITQTIGSVNFQFYNSEEIRSLSVKEITNPQTFDLLLNPNPGGLYDNALGPVDKQDVCGTCGLNFVHCPGHMGHIELPIPVFNPVFFKIMLKVLQGSCFECTRVTVKDVPCRVFVSQMELLDHGLLTSAMDVESYANHLMLDQTDHTLIPDQIQLWVKNRIKDNDEEKESSKNITAARSHFVNIFMKDYLTKSGNCPHCKQKKKRIHHEHFNKILLQQRQVKKQKKKVMNKENEIDEDDDDDELNPSKSKGNQVFLPASELRQHVRGLWKNDKSLLQHLFKALSGALTDQPTDIFFLDAIPVPPSRFRPVSRLGDSKQFENMQTANLSKLILDSVIIRQIIELKHKESKDKSGTIEIPANLSQVQGKTLTDKLQNSCVLLQTHVNCCYDADMDRLSTEQRNGIKQLLEKKEGLFRKNMMGKRVNYAARSVISPDPCINTNEIGIPEVFAKKLTYPQPVTPWNVHELRRAVINGPDKHPGASFVVNENGSKVMLNAKNKTQREAIAKQLLTPSKYGSVMGCKQVYRHLKNGDVLLLNRQPTLHKPSIQAHRARVLPGEKTLRLHYANCKAYNADFDGDEMNAHFPQNELGRAEAYTIAATDYQYLVPKDGTPLAGLIQDHMIAGASLTMRGRFFNRHDYCQLVYTALVDKKGEVELLNPALLKPRRMWSGKQVLSTVLINVIPKGKPALHLDGKAKINEKSWTSGWKQSYGIHESVSNDMGESHVIFRDGELLCGVLDKGHYGPTPYGLVHCCNELYGGAVAGQILTCFGRLFISFLQISRGFTLGVQDILVTKSADGKRTEAIEFSKTVGTDAASEALNVDLSADEEELLRSMKSAHFNRDDRQLREMDLSMKDKTDRIQNDISRACMGGLEQVFPHNNLQFMVQSGAKGSTVNCMQISCLLGQIELEGRRPPLMLSGKTLPSFVNYDMSPRAGGFVTGRFLTGIRPQEYYFHCMAGREGLVDTAVKTSRSGYLQRCLIKHLEGIMVNYDMTVRDSDGSIVQFNYGEDGLDICKTGFLKEKQFPLLLENKHILGNKGYDKDVIKVDKKVKNLQKKIRKWNKNPKGRWNSGFLKFCQEHQDSVDTSITGNIEGRTKEAAQLCQMWRKLQPEERQRYMYSKEKGGCPDPVISKYLPFEKNGVLPEKLHGMIEEFAHKDLQKIPAGKGIQPEEFSSLLHKKVQQALAQPGEAVGLLCSQSIGEPSTQMTLNTFHFAGRGEMNVTLGIPRLREILMVASANIKTPSMDVPVFNNEEAKMMARQLQIKFNRVLLHEVIKDVDISEYLQVKGVHNRQRSRIFRVRFNFLPASTYKKKLCVRPKTILNYMETVYVKHLILLIKKKIKDLKASRLTSAGKILEKPVRINEEKSHEPTREESSDVEENDGDAAAIKELGRMDEEKEYEDGEKGEDDEEPDQIQTQDVEDPEGNAEEVEMEVNDEDNMEGEEEETKALDNGENEKKKDQARINKVLQSSASVLKYSYDTKKEEWCEITLQFNIMDSKIDLPSMIDQDVRSMVLHEVPGITRCFLSTDKDGEIHLKTEGINILEIYKYSDFLDISRLYSNDIHGMAERYGIEAAGRVIIKEVQNVFGAYGIDVDYRHLSLLSDYMTYEGTYKPFNRIAMETCASPIQQMSFETTMNFLINASIHGTHDSLRSPSAQLVTGKLVTVGSGSFDLLKQLKVK